jgi:hypothetical protein
LVTRTFINFATSVDNCMLFGSTKSNDYVEIRNDSPLIKFLCCWVNMAKSPEINLGGSSSVNSQTLAGIRSNWWKRDCHIIKLTSLLIAIIIVNLWRHTANSIDVNSIVKQGTVSLNDNSTCPERAVYSDDILRCVPSNLH